MTVKMTMVKNGDTNTSKYPKQWGANYIVSKPFSISSKTSFPLIQIISKIRVARYIRRRQKIVWIN